MADTDQKFGMDHVALRFPLGAPVTSKAGLGRAAAASPLTYVDGHEPPFLILHGTDDPLVSPRHSRLLRNALEKAGTPVMMYLIPGRS